LTDLALELLKVFEGFKPTVYADAAGFATVGYGHKLMTNERELYADRTLSAREAEEMLRDDFRKHQNGVEARTVGISLNTDELEALTSLAFNIGVSALGSSTVMDLLRSGSRVEAGRAFLMWRKAGGQVLPGLVKRRHVESAWFLGAAPETLHKLLEGV
jgi:lysozyme